MKTFEGVQENMHTRKMEQEGLLEEAFDRFKSTSDMHVYDPNISYADLVSQIDSAQEQESFLLHLLEHQHQVMLDRFGDLGGGSRVHDFNRSYKEQYKVDSFSGGGESARSYLEYIYYDPSDIYANNVAMTPATDIVEMKQVLHMYSVLEELKKLDLSDSGVQQVITFWSNNRHRYFLAEISEILSKDKVVAQKSSGKLLMRLRDGHSDIGAISALLYRLELGNIGISSEGVRYFEKIYDLGDYNRADHFVQRVTGDGEIGVFDSGNTLQRIFHLGVGDLLSSEERVHAILRDIVIEELFVDKGEMSDQEQGEKELLIQEFKTEYLKISGHEIFESSNIRMNNLSLKEQGWFVLYYNAIREDSEKKERLIEFIRTHGEEGIRSFLALEYGGMNIGDKLLFIEQALPTINNGLLITKYNDLLRYVDNIDTLKEGLVDGGDKGLIGRVKSSLLRRAVSLVQDTLSGIVVAKETGEEELFCTQLTDDLDSILAEVFIFSQVYINARGDIEDIISVSEMDPKNIEVRKSENYKKMFSYNRETFTSVEGLQQLNNGFALIFEEHNGSEKFLDFSLSSSGDTVGFLSYQEVGSHTLYVRPLSFQQEARNPIVANKLMLMGIEQLGEDKKLIAYVKEGNPILGMYMKRYGFQIVERIDNFKGSKEAYYSIERPASGVSSELGDSSSTRGVSAGNELELAA
jgi:ribosomal protein S18 acetylase RimI-like enzyme